MFCPRPMLLLTLALLATACTPPPAPPATPPPLPRMQFAKGSPPPKADPGRKARLLAAMPEVASFLARQREKIGYPGLAAGVVLHGELIWTAGHGLADLKRKTQVNADSVLRIGSLTKLFTGLALLKLRDQGKLALDQPVARYLPELGQVIYPTQDSPRITIRHLVTHTSGLPRVGKLDYFTRDQAVTEAELLASLKGLPLEFCPGTRTQYSNLAMGLAGLVVARAAGVPYRQFVTRQLLAPLSMSASVWQRDAVPAGKLATGYRRKEGKLMTSHHWRMGAAESAGGLYSTVRDMGRFISYQLAAWPPGDAPDKGPVRRATVRESHQVAGHGLPGTQLFGVNWAPLKHPTLGRVVTHTGGTFLYAATVWLLPKRGLGLVLLANSGGQDGQDVTKLAAVAAGALSLVLKHDPDPGLSLSPTLRQGIARVQAMLRQPSAELVQQRFSASFLKAVPAQRVLDLLRKTGQALGRCPTFTPLRVPRVAAAVVRLQCERGTAELTLYLGPGPARQITGFGLRGLSGKK